ncbi:MAG: two-component system response regulator [Gammaproteobacteria bacterium]|nr:MAG: two-component system response regulator [Gammaproteobacteria bacterium]
MRVLIVDDSPTEMHILSNMMEKLGHAVITAENGEQGVSTAKEAKPDLILMDVVMPGINGFQATRQLHKSEETKHIPVIIVSTKDQATDKMWGRRQGAKAYVTKPVEEAELIDAINTIIHG